MQGVIQKADPPCGEDRPGIACSPVHLGLATLSHWWRTPLVAASWHARAGRQPGGYLYSKILPRCRLRQAGGRDRKEETVAMRDGLYSPRGFFPFFQEVGAMRWLLNHVFDRRGRGQKPAGLLAVHLAGVSVWLFAGLLLPAAAQMMIICIPPRQHGRLHARSPGRSHARPLARSPAGGLSRP